MVAEPALLIATPPVENPPERHPAFRAFIIADIDPIFVSIIVSCQICDHCRWVREGDFLIAAITEYRANSGIAAVTRVSFFIEHSRCSRRN
jgi:hypothetical protein